MVGMRRVKWEESGCGGPPISTSSDFFYTGWVVDLCERNSHVEYINSILLGSMYILDVITLHSAQRNMHRW